MEFNKEILNEMNKDHTGNNSIVNTLIINDKKEKNTLFPLNSEIKDKIRSRNNAAKRKGQILPFKPQSLNLYHSQSSFS